MAKKRWQGNNGIVYSTDPSFLPEEEGSRQETLPPAKQPLRIRLDTRHRSGKIVTLVEGFSGDPEDLNELGRQVKAYCGTGGSVKDGEIIIQGDHRAKVLDWLKKKGYAQAR